jgi:hypothetical protein
MGVGKYSAIKKGQVQDRRMHSRVVVRLGCQFTYDGVCRRASIMNISIKGALLSSSFSPPKGAFVTVTVQTPLLEQTLTLEGNVVRLEWDNSDRSGMCRFALVLTHTPLDLLKLISKVMEQQCDS